MYSSNANSKLGWKYVSLNEYEIVSYKSTNSYCNKEA
jgi:hypothetical protein